MLKELIIKVDNQGIHLCPKLTVPVEQTNIPIEHCKFRSHEDIFWKVELLDYSPDTKCWEMKVLDYFTKDIKNFERQRSTREVERISFEPFDWVQLKPHLAIYQKNKLLHVLYNYDTDNLSQDQHDTSASILTEQQPIVETHSVKFTVYFSDASFKLGYITFSKNIKEVGDSVDFKIKNDYILAEFENIKSWFAKKLKTRKFRVNADITTADGIVTKATATSPEISMVDQELIDSVKYQRTIALTKPPRVTETDKSLFTAEEIFGEMETGDLEGNVFNQNEQDILNSLLNKHKTRNRKQLEYLSGSKQAENNKLRFTLHPKFGFLFFIEGEENNHFVWELLNSHATYIWSIDKSEKEIELQYKRIEASVNTIRDSGRDQYKRAYRQNHHDSDLVFCVIEHPHITSNFVDGFVKWKHKLNEKIT